MKADEQFTTIITKRSFDYLHLNLKTETYLVIYLDIEFCIFFVVFADSMDCRGIVIAIFGDVAANLFILLFYKIVCASYYAIFPHYEILFMF